LSINLTTLREMVARGASAAEVVAAVEVMNAPYQRKRERDAAKLRAKRHPSLFEREPGAEALPTIGTIDEFRAESSESSDSLDSVDSVKERKVSIPSKERNTTPREARARASLPPTAKSCEITLQAFDLADAIGTEAGYTAATLPPGWCGAAGHIQRFLNEGYTPNVIRLACREVMRRGRGPPEYFGYFVKPIIDMRARLEAPLPHVKPHQLEVIDGGRQRTKIAPMEHASGPLQGAVQRIREELRRQTEPAESCPEPSGDVVRLLQAYGCQ
jgi:hypothetical protein